MTLKSLEERVAVLEKQVGTLLANVTATRRAVDWKGTRGAFTGDDLIKEVFEEGRRIRTADRKRAQPKGQKKQRSRP